MKYKLFLNKIGFSVFAQLLVNNIVVILPISFSVSLISKLSLLSGIGSIGKSIKRRLGI